MTRPPLAISIYGAQIKHLDFPRATAGGLLMYPSVLFFLLSELILLRLVYAVFLRRMSPSLPDFKKEDFISWDRGLIKELSAFDRLNCQFCAYANGITQMTLEALDVLSRQDFSAARPFFPRTGRTALFYVATAFLFSMGYFSFYLGRGVSFFCRFPEVDVVVLKFTMPKSKENIPSPRWRRLLDRTRLLFRATRENLRHIESAWCRS